MQEGKKVTAKFPLSWKESFESGVVIPTKDRYCQKCLKDILCECCELKTKELKEFEANLNELKRLPPNEFGQVIPYYGNK